MEATKSEQINSTFEGSRVLVVYYKAEQRVHRVDDTHDRRGAENEAIVGRKAAYHACGLGHGIESDGEEAPEGGLP